MKKINWWVLLGCLMSCLWTIFFVVLMTGCELWKKIDPPGEQPVCEVMPVLTSTSDKFILTGDGLGTPKFLDVKAGMLKTCPDCEIMYLGDIYPDGVSNAKEIMEKITLPTTGLSKIYFTLGNHDYRGKPEMVLDCAWYGIETPHYNFFVFDTNKLGKKQLAQAEEFLCSHSNSIGIGHHSILTYEKNHGNFLELRKMKPVAKILDKCMSRVYFSGHSHALEHNKKNLIHNFVSGGAGRPVRSVKEKGLFNKSIHGFGVLELGGFKFYDEKGINIYSAPLPY